MSMVAIISELQEREQRAPESYWWPEKSDVLRWTDSNVEAVGALLDEIAKTLASAYDQSELSFEFCDGVVNGLYGVFIELPLNQMPRLFYDVFLAFDAGEYPHKGDAAAVNPVSEYTDQQIRKIVESLTT